MKKRTIALTLCLGLVLCGCGKKNSADATVISAPATSSGLIETSDYTEPEKVTVEEGVIYEDDNITVTVTGMDSDSTNTFLFTRFDNKTDKPLVLTCEDCYVNNFYQSAELNLSIDAGASLDYGISFDNAELNSCGITTIGEMAFILAGYQQETFESVFDTSLITVKTSAADAVSAQGVDTTGDVLFDSKNLQVIQKGFTSDQDNMIAPMIMVINNSDKAVYVSAEVPDDAIEDETGGFYSFDYSYQIPAGKVVYQPMYFSYIPGEAADAEGVYEDEADADDYTLSPSEIEALREMEADPGYESDDYTESELAALEAEAAAEGDGESVDDAAMEEYIDQLEQVSQDSLPAELTCYFLFTDVDSGNDIADSDVYTFKTK